jgi:hypothetical protein
MKQADWNEKSILVPTGRKGPTAMAVNIVAKTEERHD